MEVSSQSDFAVLPIILNYSLKRTKQKCCLISFQVVGGDLNAEGVEAKPVIDFATVPGYDNVRLDKCE